MTFSETLSERINRGHAREIKSYYCAVDLGQRRDYTAIAVLEEPCWVPDEETRFALNAPAVGWVPPDSVRPEHRARLRLLNYRRGRPAHPPLSLRHLERVALGTRYPDIVQRVAALMRTPPLAGDAWLIVDATGAGGPVADMFRAALAGLVEIVITGGHEVSWNAEDGLRYKTPKRTLVAAVQALLQSDRLKIAAGLPEAKHLVDELLAFQVTISEAAHDTYEGRSGAHDDLVLSVAMAAWYRTHLMSLVDRAHARLLAPATE